MNTLHMTPEDWEWYLDAFEPSNEDEKKQYDEDKLNANYPTP